MIADERGAGIGGRKRILWSTLVDESERGLAVPAEEMQRRRRRRRGEPRAGPRPRGLLTPGNVIQRFVGPRERV